MFTKKLITLTFASIILAFSCKKTGPVIGFMLPHMTIKRYPIERDVFTQKVHELGGEVIFMSADNDEMKQFEQVKEILSKNIDILVLDPVNRFKAAGMVRAAHQKGIKVISYDRLIANCDVDYLMTFDASAIGKQMSEYVTNKMPNGKYYILGGDKTDMNAIMIDDAVTKSLAPSVTSGKINILCKMFIEKYAADEAEYQVSRYIKLSQEKPDVIIASADMLATGALKALKKFNLDGKVLITGQGGELANCKNILSGKQAMTIYKPVKLMAELAANLSMKMAKGEDVTDAFQNKLFNGSNEIPATLLKVITVDAANLRKTIVGDGMVSEAELAK
jgi:D-xylose transport system substrate-binding protein